jgi:hypothetical protein
MTRSSFAVVVVCLCVPVASAQVGFVDETGPAGLGLQQNEDGIASGVLAADYDGDGHVDLFVPQRQGVPHRLYRNNGDGTFTDVAALVGLDVLESASGGVWFDADGDWDLDLLLINHGTPTSTRARLYR